MNSHGNTRLGPVSRQACGTGRSLLKILLAGTAVAALAATPAMAQGARKAARTAKAEETVQSSSNADGTTTLEAITVTGAGDVPAVYAGGQVAAGSKVGVLGNKDFMETPFTTISYTEDYIQNREAQDIGAVIGATDPSVFVPNKRNIYETYYIRGFSSSVDDATFAGLIGMAPNMRGSSEFVERVEVLKGPSAFLYGMPPGGSVGGSVALIPKRAGDDPLTRVTTTYASDGLFGTHVDLGRRFGEEKEWGVRLNGVLRGGDTAVDDEQHNMALGSAAVDWRGENARVSFDYYRLKEDMDGVNYFGLSSIAAAVTSLPKPRTGDHSLAAPWSFNTNETETFVLRGEVDLSDSVTAYAAWGWRFGGYDALITQNSLLNNAGDMGITALRSARDGRQDSGEVGLRGNFMTGEIGHEWNVAATRFSAHNVFKDRRYNNHGSTNYYDPDFGIAPDLTAYNAMGPTSVMELDLASIAASDTMSFADDRLQVTLGLRYQSVESSTRTLATNALSSYDSSRVTPAVAALFKANENLSFYANYIEGLSQGATAPLTANNAGEVLAPYQTSQIEVGAKWDMGDFATTLSLFQIEKPSAYTDPVTNIFDTYGEQRNRGVELSVFGEVRPGLRLLGGVSYLDAKVTKSLNGAQDGRTAVGVPAVMAKMGIEYDVASVPGLTLSGNVNHVGKRYVNADNTLSLPAFTTLDLGARYAMDMGGNPLVLRASIQNVTNEAYWGGNSLAGGFGAPRTYLLSATVDF
ncbi:TonB-dependent receptor [Shinella sp.]|uniref:TonB-dependent receptor n=1 Tax=Shinella sp. TaxID=1870904 RepID=UPI0039E4E737